MATKNAFAKAMFIEVRKAQEPQERKLPPREFWDATIPKKDVPGFEALTGNAWGKFTIKGEVINWARYDNGITYNKYF
jgi:hypothetical protein